VFFILFFQRETQPAKNDVKNKMIVGKRRTSFQVIRCCCCARTILDGRLTEISNTCPLNFHVLLS
jgi:hypothetical protein